jgi:type II secretory pathway component PulF
MPAVLTPNTAGSNKLLAPEARRAAPAPVRGRRIARRELASVTSQLAIMTRSGIDVTSALQSLARQCRNPSLKRVLQSVHEQVLSGKSFSQALKAHAGLFGNAYVATVASGEASGRMPEVLGRLAQLQRNELRLRGTVRTLMAYPMVLVAVSSLVIVALVLFVLPQFAEIFAQYETPLPALTQALISLSLELRERWWLWGSLAAAAAPATIVARQSPAVRRTCDRAALHLRPICHVTRTLLIGRTCGLLGMMLQSGVPLLESLRLVQSSLNNTLYCELFADLERDVLNGRGISGAFAARGFIPQSATDMIAAAEQTGNLGPVAELLGEHFEEEGEARLRELIALAEPAITVVMGVIVGIVVMSVMLPMYDLTTFAERGG